MGTNASLRITLPSSLLAVALLSATTQAQESWTQLSPVGPLPAARVNHSLATVADGKILLFGGEGATGRRQDTWLYDLASDSWQEVILTTHPSTRDGLAMAYAGDDRAVLFGGYYSGQKKNDTWVFDLSDWAWTLQTPVGPSPPARTAHGMVPIGGDRVAGFRRRRLDAVR